MTQTQIKEELKRILEDSEKAGEKHSTLIGERGVNYPYAYGYLTASIKKLIRSMD